MIFSPKIFLMELDGYSLTISGFKQIVFDNEIVKIKTEANQRVEESFAFLKSFAANKLIYGINIVKIE